MNTMNQNFLMSGGYITGLTQQMVLSFVLLYYLLNIVLDFNLDLKFTITADLNSKYVLDSINSYFGCGKVTINNKNYTAEYE